MWKGLKLLPLSWQPAASGSSGCGAWRRWEQTNITASLPGGDKETNGSSHAIATNTSDAERGRLCQLCNSWGKSIGRPIARALHTSSAALSAVSLSFSLIPCTWNWFALTSASHSDRHARRQTEKSLFQQKLWLVCYLIILMKNSGKPPTVVR